MNPLGSLKTSEVNEQKIASPWQESTRIHKQLRSKKKKIVKLTRPYNYIRNSLKHSFPENKYLVEAVTWNTNNKLTSWNRKHLKYTYINEVLLPWALNTLSSASCEYEILVALRSWRNSSFTMDGGTSLTFKDAYDTRKHVH